MALPEECYQVVMVYAPSFREYCPTIKSGSVFNIHFYRRCLYEDNKQGEQQCTLLNQNKNHIGPTVPTEIFPDMSKYWRCLVELVTDSEFWTKESRYSRNYRMTGGQGYWRDGLRLGIQLVGVEQIHQDALGPQGETMNLNRILREGGFLFGGSYSCEKFVKYLEKRAGVSLRCVFRHTSGIHKLKDRKKLQISEGYIYLHEIYALVALDGSLMKNNWHSKGYETDESFTLEEWKDNKKLTWTEAKHLKSEHRRLKDELKILSSSRKAELKKSVSKDIDVGLSECPPWFCR